MAVHSAGGLRMDGHDDRVSLDTWSCKMVGSNNDDLVAPRYATSRLSYSIANMSDELNNQHSKSSVDLGLGLPIGDPDPSIKVVGVLCGYRRPRWRGRDRGR
ncbi:hypothetical protein CRG98_047584 [Punica granatum]|uniref:Uncharacterized protein n=1 Tax=Punica granatum TaxID=22663 RepID=A0A2I0HK37_PUNGR|nr:hypothetical protein CRG98_047584 [Punica granatum]